MFSGVSVQHFLADDGADPEVTEPWNLAEQVARGRYSVIL